MTNNEEYPAYPKQNDENEDQPKCAECHADLYLGDEMIQLEAGVLGGKGFVPLPTERTIHLCDSECAKRFFIPGGDVVQIKRRVP